MTYVYIFLLWLVAFISLWCFVIWLVSRLSGWHQLAQRYGVHRPFDGKRWHMQSIGMRYLSNYSNIITMGAGEQGIFFSILFPFGVGHAPLFIPWENITVTSKKWFFEDAACLTFEGVEGVYILLPRFLFAKLKEYSGGLEKI
jgi:hypothetical protein